MHKNYVLKLFWIFAILFIQSTISAAQNASISGRVVDEYGMEIEPEEFIKMALEWGEPDGATFDAEYEAEFQKKHPNYRAHGPKYYDRIVDGLRVSSSTDFS